MNTKRFCSRPNQSGRILCDLTDERLKIWARVRLGGERGVNLAHEYGYRSGAGVTLLVRRLEANAQQDRKLNWDLESLRKNASPKL